MDRGGLQNLETNFVEAGWHLEWARSSFIDISTHWPLYTALVIQSLNEWIWIPMEIRVSEVYRELLKRASDDTQFLWLKLGGLECFRQLSVEEERDTLFPDRDGV